MQVRVITMRYQEGLQGFPEDALRAATFGKTVLDVRECPHSDATRRGRRGYFARRRPTLYRPGRNKLRPSPRSESIVRVRNPLTDEE